MKKGRDVIVAVPVRDEAERIGDCVWALALQHGIAGHRILLLLNNCRDNSAQLIRDMQPSLPVRILLDVRELPPENAAAGIARRLAMQQAADLLPSGGVLLTTDADSRVAPDWIAANLFHLRQGADAVMGRAIIDPREAAAIPARLHDDDARECAYAALLDELAHLIDPDPHDPWPRHDEHSGASIAVRRETYLRAGGMPGVMLAEDRLFYEALRRVDARIRHAPDVRVVVSGRLQGRAPGGMADTIRRRMAAPDAFLDDKLETVPNALRRIILRAAAREIWRTGADVGQLARDLQLEPVRVADALSHRWFGTGWAALERASPVLERQPVPVRALAEQTVSAMRLRDRLRSQRDTIIPAAKDPSDIPGVVPVSARPDSAPTA